MTGKCPVSSFEEAREVVYAGRMNDMIINFQGKFKFRLSQISRKAKRKDTRDAEET
jgi:hypothetical protein